MGAAGQAGFGYDGLDLVWEYAPDGSLLRRYVHVPGIDQPIVWYEGAGTSDRRYLHADERGSIVAVTNNAGTSIGMWHYKPRIPASPPLPPPSPALSC